MIEEANEDTVITFVMNLTQNQREHDKAVKMKRNKAKGKMYENLEI